MGFCGAAMYGKKHTKRKDSEIYERKSSFACITVYMVFDTLCVQWKWISDDLKKNEKQQNNTEAEALFLNMILR